LGQAIRSQDVGLRPGDSQVGRLAAVNQPIASRKDPMPVQDPIPFAPSRPPGPLPLWPAAGPRALRHAPRPQAAEWATSAEPLPGIERRLVRRAERLWDELRGTAPQPGQQALHHFLASAFAPQALLIRFSGEGHGCRCEIGAIGTRLDSLAVIVPGPVAPTAGPAASVAQRLAALAERAMLLGSPLCLEIDAAVAPVPTSEGQPQGPDGGDAGLLLRAIALPFMAPQPEAPQPVLVVASWRHLLPAEAVARLHAELSAAVAAMNPPPSTRVPR
jgi:hypothetical protein